MQPVEGVMVTEAVAAQPRTPLPAVIVDQQPPALDADLVAEGAGLLSIRSVYDIMGVDQARTTAGTATSIANVSNPSLAQYGSRLARFVRIEKPVSIPDDDDIADPDNSAFGPTGVMREIVAYAPVEPDGSVRMKVPANVAFQISVLDANGRRFSPVHRSWLQVRPGEVLECNGCHVRNAATATTTPMVHGRKGLFNAVNAGATATGPLPRRRHVDFVRRRRHHGARALTCRLFVHRPDHDDRTLRPAVDHAERQRRLRRDLEASRAAHRFVLVQLSTVDDGHARPTSAASRSGLRPAASPCTTPTIGTRPGHIHPLWSVARVPADPPESIPMPTASSNLPVDLHELPQPREPSLRPVQLPAASLELDDEVSNEDALQLRAYRQLLFPAARARDRWRRGRAALGAPARRQRQPRARRQRQPGVHDSYARRRQWPRAMRAARGSST